MYTGKIVLKHGLKNNYGLSVKKIINYRSSWTQFLMLNTLKVSFNIANSLRPSKNYMYRKIFSKINKTSLGKNIVGDLASNNCRNSRFFLSDKFSYWGFDKNFDVLENSVLKDPGLNCVKCDLINDILPKSVFDLVLTTETIEHFGSNSRVKKGVNNILKTLRSEGIFIINSHEKDIQNWLSKNLREKFKTVKIFGYRNLISRAYEGMLEEDGHVRPSKIRLLQFGHFGVNQLMVGLEIITSFMNISNSAKLYVCEGFKSEEKDEKIEHSIKNVNKKNVYFLNV